jgi:hypothetical protein
MKKTILILICFATMMVASTDLKAQELTITLVPGYTWISIPGMDTLDFATALGSFTPMTGDIIKSKGGNVRYRNGQWVGAFSQFYPGHGYMYISNRTEPVTLTFTMSQPASQVVVTTSEPTDITAASAVVASTVTIDEDNHIYARGVCYDTIQMPTVDNRHTTDSLGAGNLTTILTKLYPNTTYYARVYVVSDYGLIYGEEQSFTTLDNSGGGNIPEGAINGLFTINADGDQVYFSQGNLQYKATDSLWRFADNQYDYIGNANSNISPSYNDWIDLFGWGTSGYDHGAICYQPWSKSGNYVDYYAYGVWNKNLNDESGMADWGYNAISNGGNQGNYWRTLTQSEWDYILFTRNTTSDIRFAKATVREMLIDTILNDTVFNDIHGIVLFPDSWNESAYVLNDANEGGAPYETNMISDSTWETLEGLGVVFLPAAGNRNASSNVLYPNSMGYYWSTTYDNNKYAYNMSFSDSRLVSGDSFYRYFGRSVRLVRDYEY